METMTEQETIEAPRGLAQHSNASADWGTPELGRRFAAAVLKPASRSGSIDLDYASSAYWQMWWPDKSRPSAYLDGSKGRDVLIEADRHAAVKAISLQTCGAGFQNAPGLNGGEMVQRCWEVMEADHRSEWLDSGVWWGFSLEQFASLQGIGKRNPLTVDAKSLITTFVPSRRARYVLHPEAYIAILEKKRAKRDKTSPAYRTETRELDKLRARSDDSPVTPPAPPHASYITVLWSHDRATRKRQMEAARSFLKAQQITPEDGRRFTGAQALLQEVAIVGEITL